MILTARASLADHYVVPSGSMRPNVEVGDRILVDKTAYGLRAPMTRWPLVPASGPARGDVVVLDAPDGAVTLLKRVVAVPGDTVSVRGGVVDDGSGGAGATYRISLEDGGGDDFGPVRVPEGHYLVLGDNRGSSRDGRTFGLVRRDAILGKAARVVWRDGGPAWIGL